MTTKIQTIVINVAEDSEGEPVVTVQVSFKDGTMGNISKSFYKVEEALAAVKEHYQYSF